MDSPKRTPLQLYNTLHRRKMEFVPLNAPEVDLYTCGPTVYGYAHIGNLRTYVFEDILKRTLIQNGYKVKHVMNITDVGHLTDDADSGDDKMEDSARREKKSVWDIAAKYTSCFQKEIKKLHILPPNIWCKATEHIKEQIDLVKRLETDGFAYRIEDGIYYDTAKFPKYNELAKLELDKRKAGARVEMSKGKRNLSDFALWKFSPTDKKRQMEWESPWGKGFPGWHIECSAMSMHYLGEQFDIHCGGIDHVTVHHTNEIAQVEAITGKQWVNYWLHGEFLLMREEKMAKSKGNTLTLEVLEKEGIPPLAYRYFLLNAHYRKQLFFTDQAINGAKNGYANLERRVIELKKEVGEKNKGSSEEKEAQKYRHFFLKAINDDLNTPQALAVAWELLQDKKLSPPTIWELLCNFDRVLGLGIEEMKESTEEIPADVLEMVAKRQKAREGKNWPLSDQIRDQLTQLGWKIKDSKEGAKVEKIS